VEDTGDGRARDCCEHRGGRRSVGAGLLRNFGSAATERGARRESVAMTETATVTADHIRGVFQRYVELVTRGDFEAVALLYAADASVEDPVGSAPHRGRAAIREFYRASAGKVRLDLEGRVRVAGREAAAAMVARPTGMAGMVVETVDVMTFDDAGRITSMRAYWSPDTIYPE
jgi:steroid Delta-isomerase